MYVRLTSMIEPVKFLHTYMFLELPSLPCFEKTVNRRFAAVNRLQSPVPRTTRVAITRMLLLSLNHGFWQIQSHVGGREGGEEGGEGSVLLTMCCKRNCTIVPTKVLFSRYEYKIYTCRYVARETRDERRVKSLWHLGNKRRAIIDNHTCTNRIVENEWMN